MKKLVLAALVSASLAAGFGGLAQAQPRYRSDLSQFDVRNARTWAERLVLCDTTAFLATHPDLDANRMFVRRDDGRRDLMLPPDFVGGGRWYKEGYEQLYWRLRRQRQITSDELYRVQDNLGRPFVRMFRDSHRYYGLEASRFLDRQDTYCRRMARQEGFIIS
jgi:hypothetical protein